MKQVINSLRWFAATISLSTMVFSPLALGAESKRVKALQIQQAIEELGLNKKQTLGQFYEKNKNILPERVKQMFSVYVKENPNQPMPQFEVVTVKSSSGDYIPNIRATQGNDLFNLQWFGESQKFIKFQNTILREVDVVNFSDMFERVMTIEPRLRKQSEPKVVGRMIAPGKFKYPTPTARGWKKMTGREKATYIVNLRTLWQDAKEVLKYAPKTQQILPAKPKKTSDYFFEKNRLFFNLFFGEPAEAAMANSCVVAGYVSVYRNVGGRQLCSASEAKSRYRDDELYRLAASKCTGSTIVCNPYVYGAPNGNPICVPTNDISSNGQIFNATTFDGRCDSGSRLQSADTAFSILKSPLDRSKARYSPDNMALTESEISKHFEDDQKANKQLVDNYLLGMLKLRGKTTASRIEDVHLNSENLALVREIKAQFEQEITKAKDSCNSVDAAQTNSGSTVQVESQYWAACDQLHRRFLFIDDAVKRNCEAHGTAYNPQTNCCDCGTPDTPIGNNPPTDPNNPNPNNPDPGTTPPIAGPTNPTDPRNPGGTTPTDPRNPGTGPIAGPTDPADPGTTPPDPIRNPGPGVTPPTDPRNPGTGPIAGPTDPRNPGTQPTDPRNPGTGPITRPTDPRNPGTGPISGPTTPTDPRNPGTGPIAGPTDPRNPGTGPITQPTDPRNPGTGPIAGPTDPRNPGTQPTDPRNPGTGPIAGPTDPRNPGTGPIAGPTDPRNPGTGPITQPTDPRNPGTGPIAGPTDPRNPGTGPITQPTDPRNPGPGVTPPGPGPISGPTPPNPGTITTPGTTPVIPTPNPIGGTPTTPTTPTQPVCDRYEEQPARTTANAPVCNGSGADFPCRCSDGQLASNIVASNGQSSADCSRVDAGTDRGGRNRNSCGVFCWIGKALPYVAVLAGAYAIWRFLGPKKPALANAPDRCPPGSVNAIPPCTSGVTCPIGSNQVPINGTCQCPQSCEALGLVTGPACRCVQGTNPNPQTPNFTCPDGSKAVNYEACPRYACWDCNSYRDPARECPPRPANPPACSGAAATSTGTSK